MTEQRSWELAPSSSEVGAQPGYSVARHPEEMELPTLLTTLVSTSLVLLGVVVVAVLAIVPTVLDPAG